MNSLNFSHEAIELRKAVAALPRDMRILDVGCGFGRNLALLKSLGFSRLVGVDINADLVAQARQSGFACETAEEFAKDGGEMFDALLLSHIVEHFSHTDLIAFLSSYFARLKPGGVVIIITPLFHRCFYNDFDHVRPYLPMGFKMVYDSVVHQVGLRGGHVLEIEDIRFFRDQFRLQFYRRMYLPQANPLPLWINRGLKLAYVLSRGRIGQKIGWVGVYRYGGPQDGAGA